MPSKLEATRSHSRDLKAMKKSHEQKLSTGWWRYDIAETALALVHAELKLSLPEQDFTEKL